MSNFLDKFENFLFDFLGLVLPGFILLAVVIAPLFLFDFSIVPVACFDRSDLLSLFAIISKYLSKAFESKSQNIIFVLLILSYILGHVVKVLSIIFYEFFSWLIDGQILKRLTENINSLKGENWLSRFIKDIALEKIHKAPLSLFHKLFVFDPAWLPKGSDEMLGKCVDRINERLATSLPKEWNYPLFKFSTALFEQENKRSLTIFFLAKYNLYRSLSFIFLASVFYFILFFNVMEEFLNQNQNNLKEPILWSLILLWFTFHVKYKRYWTLCGNEALVSLFHYLYKGKLTK